MKLIVDAMGGDLDCDIPVCASIQALLNFPIISQLILVGDESRLASRLRANSDYPAVEHRIALQHSDGVISMHDKPAAVLKQRSDTSMLQAIQGVASGRADACVSAGNTGALVGLARHFCGLHATIKRLAICAQLPTQKRSSYLLDVGGNVDCSAEQLYQFARMGCALVESLGVAQPCRVSALSIGVEAGKGNAAVKQAAALCSQNTEMNFTGMIEGDSLLLGESDVIFCDGFVGNIALKSSEGTARYIRSLVESLSSNGDQAVAPLEQQDKYHQFMQAINPDQFNGAYLLGLKHLVVKAHGGSNAEGFGAAIGKAVHAVEGNLQSKLAALL
jgi:glycerol-3-phosphate acyltransferase PlsX